MFLSWTIRKLRSPDLNVRLKAVDDLTIPGVSPTLHTLQTLAEVLKHDAHPDARLKVASALGRYRELSLLAPLVSALDDQDERVRLAAALAIEALKDVLIRSGSWGRTRAGNVNLEALANVGESGDGCFLAAFEVLMHLGWQPKSATDRLLQALATGDMSQVERLGAGTVDLLLDKVGSRDERMLSAVFRALAIFSSEDRRAASQIHSRRAIPDTDWNLIQDKKISIDRVAIIANRALGADEESFLKQSFMVEDRPISEWTSRRTNVSIIVDPSIPCERIEREVRIASVAAKDRLWSGEEDLSKWPLNRHPKVQNCVGFWPGT